MSSDQKGPWLCMRYIGNDILSSYIGLFSFKPWNKDPIINQSKFHELWLET